MATTNQLMSFINFPAWEQTENKKSNPSDIGIYQHASSTAQPLPIC